MISDRTSWPASAGRAAALACGPYWGEMTCTAEDESRVISYVPNRLPAPLPD